MDLGRFHLLSDGFMRGAIRARPDAELFPLAFPLARGEATLERPGRFTYDEGTKARDLVGTTVPPLRLVSDRVIQVLTGFTGWVAYPAELYGRDGERVPGYHGLSVTGRCGPIDDDLSPPRTLTDEFGHEHRGRVGYLFHPETWDGSDVFVPGVSALTMVGEEVRDALVAAGVKNVRLERITEIETMVRR